MMRASLVVTLTFICFVRAHAGHSSSDASVNPIRKVVTLMQEMQKDISQQGEKEKELFDKFMCYCESTTSDLTDASDEAKSQIEEYTSRLSSEKAEKQQLDQELAEHKSDRQAATQDLATASSIRTKENAEFKILDSESKTNIAALGAAIPALEKGMGGAALMQLPEAGPLLRKLLQTSPMVSAYDRKRIVAFLDAKNGVSTDDDYAPQSGQIVGIIKNMKDEMEKSQSQATAEETSAAEAFENMKAAKTNEISVASQAIESKGVRSGALAVSVVESSAALDDSSAELADATKYLASLKATCEEKSKEWSARQTMRAQEVAAISEAISILNDDDALDVFKKAIPSALLQTLNKAGGKTGFLQMSSSARRLAKAAAILESATSFYKSTQMELLSYNLRSALKQSQAPTAANVESSGDFGTVNGIIDDMIVVLENEGKDDEKHKEWCTEEFADSEGEQAEVQDKADAIAAAISELTDEVKTNEDDIVLLEEEIKKMDASVALASINRKKEHSEYTESLTLTEAATQLIGKAKNRLQKFYNPALYKEQTKKELSMEDAVYTRLGGQLEPEAPVPVLVQVSAHSQVSKGSATKVAPPVPPETWGAYQKAGGKSGGVMGLMDMLVTELQADQAQAKHDEQMAQKEYDDLMQESRDTRQNNGKSIIEKEATKASLEKKLEASKENQAMTQDELSNIHTYIGELHSSCDFVMQNFDLRREARANEIDSLKNAKAVLAGANFS